MGNPREKNCIPVNQAKKTSMIKITKQKQITYLGKKKWIGLHAHNNKIKIVKNDKPGITSSIIVSISGFIPLKERRPNLRFSIGIKLGSRMNLKVSDVF